MTPAERILSRSALPTLLALAWPNVLASLIQSLMIVVDGWYAGSIGTEALAAVALVFPLFMLTMMLSAGAIGGAVTGAMARANGAGDVRLANAILRFAVLVALGIGTLKGLVVVLVSGHLFPVMGGDGTVGRAAAAYAIVLFPGIAVIWLANMLASALRGLGDMVRPAFATALIVMVHAILSVVQSSLGAPLGIAGAALSLLAGYGVGVVYLVWVLRGTTRPVRLTRDGWRGLGRCWPVLRAGALAGTQSAVTIAYAMVATAAFGGLGTVWLAGYGIGSRLELMIVPVIFGVGGAGMVATGTLLGANRRGDAVRMGWLTAVLAGGMAGLIGTVVALWPGIWTSLFTDDADIAAAGARYLGMVGPFYAFFGIGLALYFASQGLATLLWPVLGAFVRFAIVALGLGVLAATDQATPGAMLTLIAGAMVVYALFNAGMLHFGPWNPRPPGLRHAAPNPR